ncbi:MarR family winged helix-turn-helix transcriptional regulator [Clostridium sp. MT-14]|jgi:DNA-binding MarR family transcriptional regulator|uniref:MarR family winged helix-turn-helix transcriptional regulator n=1 Tax=unclassified Clostridium TaxID=2614128 RepID=UPI00123850A3|nr:MarR family transcriptional regulator [Clostridium sp. HV4-5-A1G]KAA8670632.1 MarR family transcriptional regulator [Clostridium sp. HV4-5-A1G]CAB1249862.1 hypothetical protein CLOSBL3_11972 [Clostridiaceae bacterium BL-3]
MDEDKQDLLCLFTRIEWLLHRYYHYYRTVHGPMGNPHRGQGRILSLLKMQPEITQKKLTYLLDMRPQSVGELLAKLEQNGYITRTASEADRRRINIKLTESGAEVVNKGNQQPEDFNEIFDCLTQEEQYTFKEYLNRIIDSLEQKTKANQRDSDFGGYKRQHSCGHHRNKRHEYF